MLSPTACRRGELDRAYLCLTDAVQVTTLSSPTAQGRSSRIALPGYSVLHGELDGVSVPGGVWLTAQTFQPGGAESVTMKFVPDAIESRVKPKMFVWQPVAPKPELQRPTRPMMTF